MASAERKLLKIGELARMADKTVRALHLYEELELLRPARRTQGGFRMYDSANVARITYIDRLQRLGYSLGDIRALVERWEAGESPREAMASIEAAYVARLDEVRRQIRELRKLEGIEALRGVLAGYALDDNRRDRGGGDSGDGS